MSEVVGVRRRARELAYEASLILAAAGYGLGRVAGALAELGLPAPREWRGPLEPTPLTKALFYHRAYELALRLRDEHPGWSCRRIATELRRRLGVNVPYATVYYWVKRGTRPNVAPIRLLPELGYAVGALMTDCARGSDYVKLEVRDRDFAEQFARALTELTEKSYDVGEEEGGCYAVTVGARR